MQVIHRHWVKHSVKQEIKMSSHYQSHKHQANARIKARIQEAEMHRLAKQGSQKGGFSLFSAVKNLFGRRQSSESADQRGNALGSPRRRRYAD
jgi:hypothetical protein